MTCRGSISVCAVMVAASCVAASAAHAQKESLKTEVNSFTGSIWVPFDLKSLSPEVKEVELVCRIMQPKSDWDEGIVWNGVLLEPLGPSGVPVSPKSPSVDKTLVRSFRATRATPFKQGEVWNYSCGAKLARGVPGTTPIEWAMAGTGPAFKDWAQVAIGTATVEGIFTLR
ncbi:MAG: hypothetical protein ABJD07_09855 [Gemmatimonadaceae bacterium]